MSAKPELKAFISYRRDDAFNREPGAREPDFAFIHRLSSALLQVGFTHVFVDIDVMPTADDFRDRIREEIKDSDLIVAVIGERWLDILKERAKGPERDILVREIRTALRNEKEILPLLVDGAKMPGGSDLPTKIEEFHYRNALKVERSTALETLVAELAPIYEKVSSARRRKDTWRAIYITAAIFAYLICTTLIHTVGHLEYRGDPWWRMAEIWSGFFLWPVICLPFALVALYRPLTIVFEFAAESRRLRDRLTYVLPLLMGLAVTALAMTVEIVDQYEAPWTIHPTLTGCTDGRKAVPARYDVLANYDRQNSLKAEYSDPPFWLEDKCWPNALFYLIEPHYRQIFDGRQYAAERPAIQGAFVSLLNRKSESPYSWVFFAYVASFSIQIWFAATGVILAIFYLSERVRRPDGRIVKLPSEDTYLCLTYAFVTLMIWIPFRLNTVKIKQLYFCEDYLKCDFHAVYYQNDILLGIMFLVGYIYLTAGLLRKFKRLSLTVAGGTAVAGTLVCAVLVVAYASEIARMAQSWQFYLRVLIIVMVLLYALWRQFDPTRVHDRDDEEDSS